MEMTIDEKTIKQLSHSIKILQKANSEITGAYDKLKTQYEARLKADLEAILVDLQLDIEGQKFDTHIDKDVWNDAIRVCSDLIQQRINELKGESEEKL